VLHRRGAVAHHVGAAFSYGKKSLDRCLRAALASLALQAPWALFLIVEIVVDMDIYVIDSRLLPL